MPALINLIGRSFTHWTVIERSGNRWLCRCQCGSERRIRSDTLIDGSSTNCGCKKNYRIIHGRSRIKDRTFQAWCDMRARVSRDSYYKNRIFIHPRWNTFLNFLFDMGDCPTGLTLDRINGDKDYEPGNCRWATWQEQASNKKLPRRHIVKAHFQPGYFRGKTFVRGFWMPEHERGGRSDGD